MVAPASSSIQFRALHLANEQRSSYGLRYNDFTRYRKHCANRTHRLRSTLKMTHGKGREFKKLPLLTPDMIKNGHLQLLLFEAERAWAYAQELIIASLLPTSAANARDLRHSATGRFRRAVHWATQLLSHSQAMHTAGRLTARGLLHATVYTLIMNGRFLRSRDAFDDALGQLCVARSLLDALAREAETSRAQALAVLFADEVGPEIRHCAHELGMERAYDIDRIVRELAGRHQEDIVEGCVGLIEEMRVDRVREGRGETRGRRRLEELRWEGEVVPVRHPELVDVLLRVQEAEARLEGGNKAASESQVDGNGKIKTPKENGSKKGVAAYDAILLALSDAEEAARKLSEAQQLSGATSGVSKDGGRDIQFLHAYIIYQLLSRRIQRDLLLVSALLTTSKVGLSRSARKSGDSMLKPKSEQVDSRLYPAVVKLLDAVLQSLNQMRTLSVVDDSPDLAAAVEARILFTKARRCLYLARCYAPLKKYAEALTLFQHANIHIRETISTLALSSPDLISSTHPSFFPLTTTDVKDLEDPLASDSLHFKRDWFAYNGGSIDTGAGMYGVRSYKPLFFNIALNYVELDMDRLLARAGKQPVPTVETTAKQMRMEPPQEKKVAIKAKVEETRAATPEPHPLARGGLGSLLGGWWGRS